MTGESTPCVRFSGCQKLCPSDGQTFMFSDVFAQTESRFNPNRYKTGIYDFSARVAAISTLDKGIDATRQFLLSLLTRRNALVPISLLPPEILARVFHLLVLEEPPAYRKQNLGWIRVTHVCRNWRRVALDDLSLWAKIRDTRANTKWISEILARAKDAPLDIELDAAAWPRQKVLLMIPPHLSHTRQLRFRNLSALRSGTILEIYSSEAPVLEHFELKVAKSSPITLPDLGGGMPFKGRAPRLRTFSLSGVIIPWALIPRGQLTRLKIAYITEIVGPLDASNQLFDLLVNCPLLEILNLEECLPSQLTESLHGQIIYLPHLSRLRLYGSTTRVVTMLKMLNLPSSTTLRLNAFNKSSLDSDSEGLLLPAISAHFRSPAPIEFKSLTVSVKHFVTHSCIITASSFPSTLRNRPLQSFKGDIVGNPELVLSLDKLSEHGGSTKLLRQTCKMLPISNLEFISMSAKCNSFPTNAFEMNWVELLGYCINVTTIQVIGNGTSNLVRALTAPTVTNAGSSEEGRKWNHDNRESTVARPPGTQAHAHAAIFPELKILDLNELDLAEGKGHPSGMLFDVFERGLQQRMAASGAPLKVLRVSDCDISTEHAKDLQKFAQDFHCDEDGSLYGGLIQLRRRDVTAAFAGYCDSLYSSDRDPAGDDDADSWDHY